MPGPVQIETDRPWSRQPLYRPLPSRSQPTTLTKPSRRPYHYIPYTPQNQLSGNASTDFTSTSRYTANLTEPVPPYDFYHPLLLPRQSVIPQTAENAISPPPVRTRIPIRNLTPPLAPGSPIIFSEVTSACSTPPRFDNQEQEKEQSYLSAATYCEPEWLGVLRAMDVDADASRGRVSAPVAKQRRKRERSTTLVGDSVPTSPILHNPEHPFSTSSRPFWTLVNQSIINSELKVSPSSSSSQRSNPQSSVTHTPDTPGQWPWTSAIEMIAHRVPSHMEIKDVGAFYFSSEQGLLAHETRVSCRECVKNAWETWIVANPGAGSLDWMVPDSTLATEPHPVPDQASVSACPLEAAITSAWSRRSASNYSPVLNLQPYRFPLEDSKAELELRSTFKFQECEPIISNLFPTVSTLNKDTTPCPSPPLSRPRPARRSANDYYSNPLDLSYLQHALSTVSQQRMQAESPPRSRTVTIKDTSSDEPARPKRMRLWNEEIKGESHLTG